jgi:hypothetical protein
MTAQNINMNVSQHTTAVFQTLPAPKGRVQHLYQFVSHSDPYMIELHKTFKSMPSTAIHFVGRDEQLKQLQLYFQPRKSTTSDLPRRSCAIHGIGGIGKSQLILKFIEINREACVFLFWVQMFANNRWSQVYTHFLDRCNEQRIH